MGHATPPLTKPDWSTYRRYRYGWWFTLAACVLALILLPVEFGAVGVVAVATYGAIVSRIKCPICGYSVGYNAHAKFRLFRPSPWGGWCASCGERLFLRPASPPGKQSSLSTGTERRSRGTDARNGR